MKKLCILLSIVLAISILHTTTLAAAKGGIESSSEIFYISEDIYIESVIEEDTVINLFSTSHFKSASKTYYIRNNNDENLASFKLSASFTYNSSTSSCTSVNYSTTIYDDSWKFTSTSASKSENIATGEFTAKKYVLLIAVQTVSKTLIITCDKDGKIS